MFIPRLITSFYSYASDSAGHRSAAVEWVINADKFIGYVSACTCATPCASTCAQRVCMSLLHSRTSNNQEFCLSVTSLEPKYSRRPFLVSRDNNITTDSTRFCHIATISVQAQHILELTGLFNVVAASVASVLLQASVVSRLNVR